MLKKRVARVINLKTPESNKRFIGKKKCYLAAPMSRKFLEMDLIENLWITGKDEIHTHTHKSHYNKTGTHMPTYLVLVLQVKAFTNFRFVQNFDHRDAKTH